MKRIVWDLETMVPPKLDDAGKPDWDGRGEGNRPYYEYGLISCCVTYEPGTADYRIFTQWDSGNGSHDIDGLADYLESADECIGFNSRRFDQRLLESTLRRQVNIKNVDILECIWNSLGRQSFGGWSLDTICKRMFARGKTEESGAGAPTLAKELQIGRLLTYCLVDVKLTALLHQFIVRHGWLLDPGGRKQRVSLQVKGRYSQGVAV